MSADPILEPARRLSDAVAQAVTDGNGGLWLAVRLSDGKPWRDRAYESRRAAWTDAPTSERETGYAYLNIPHMGMPYAEAVGWLSAMRRLAEAGHKVADPDGADVVLPTTRAGMSQLLATPTPDLTRHLNRRTVR